MTNHHKTDFFRSTKRGKILRAMTLSDVTFWGTTQFISVILVLFVIQFVEGGSATHAGLAYLAYRGVAALTSIPFGRFFDKHKGYIDEVWGLAIASFITGGVYVALSFATELWHLYAAMAAMGMFGVVNMLSWRTLFYHNVKKSEYSETIGAYEAVMSLSQGIALALGGFMGDTFGFDTVVFYGGIVIFLSGFFPLSVKAFLVRKRDTS